MKIFNWPIIQSNENDKINKNYFNCNFFDDEEESKNIDKNKLTIITKIEEYQSHL